ncbi:MAG: hypothetical protein Q9214_001980 [Letrouitia sp. 1 TL-2023]
MEGGDQHRRQYEQPNYSQYGSSLRSNAPPPNVSERFRQSQLVAGRTQTSTPLRAPGENPQELVNFAYEQTQQYPPPQTQGVALPYQTDYTQDSQRGQQFATYPTQMMYNVPQQQQIQSPYEAAQHSQQRQSTAVEALSTQFGVPPFYHGSESTGASGPASTSQQYTLTHFQQPIPYQNPGSAGRITLPSSFPTASAEYQSTTAADVAEQQEQDSSAFDVAYNQYQEALKQTFEYSSKGRLAEAGQSLLEISEWLLGHASELGLVSDDQALHEERLKLWNEFNMCWLAALQRQKDDTLLMNETGRPPTSPQSLLDEAFLEKMGSELVRLCDGMEKYGLVDYQMGVWEEEIISILTQCLDLLPPAEEETPEPQASDETAAQLSSSK